MTTYARFPPEETLVADLLRDFGDLMGRREQERMKKFFDEPKELAPRDLRPLPAGGPDLIEHLNRFRDAPELAPEDVDFDTANPDLLSVQRTVRKRRGSLWQLPKEY